MHAKDIAAQLRRRRDAALRLPVLEHLGVADPWDALGGPDGPASYGLTGRELATEATRCIDAGWSGWEVRTRFLDPRTVDHEGVAA